MNTNYPHIPYQKKLVEKARVNRKNPTAAEKKMWFKMLRNRAFRGLKFTRQKPLDKYIVDFYCSKLLLAIEIDGDSHVAQQEYDKERTKRLGDYGITVIRYTNREVLESLSGVFDDLNEKVEMLEESMEEN